MGWDVGLRQSSVNVKDSPDIDQLKYKIDVETHIDISTEKL